jgi:hypothetical protein
MSNAAIQVSHRSRCTRLKTDILNFWPNGDAGGIVLGEFRGIDGRGRAG